MKRIVSCIIMLIFLAANISAADFDWKSLDATVVDRAEDGSQTTVVLKDKQNHSFKVIYEDDQILAKLAGKIVKFKNEFYAWKGIKIKDVSFMIQEDLLQIVVIPQEIAHNGENLAPAISAGITMTYDAERDLLLYDFRVMKDSMFIRVEGIYMNEDELAVKLRYAYDNPAVYQQQVNTLTELESIRQALIYLNNEDWMGRFRAVPPETIQKVVEIKQKNPTMNKKQLWKAVRKAKIKINWQEFNLIMIIYFNMYD